MSDKLDLKKLLGTDFTCAAPTYTRPKGAGVDDVTVYGLPKNFDPEKLCDLVHQEFSERNEFRPGMVWAIIPEIDEDHTVWLLFEKPLERDTLGKIMSCCAQDLEKALSLPENAVNYNMSRSGQFRILHAHLSRGKPSPSKPDGPN